MGHRYIQGWRLLTGRGPPCPGVVLALYPTAGAGGADGEREPRKGRAQDCIRHTELGAKALLTGCLGAGASPGKEPGESSPLLNSEARVGGILFGGPATSLLCFCSLFQRIWTPSEVLGNYAGVKDRGMCACPNYIFIQLGTGHNNQLHQVNFGSLLLLRHIPKIDISMPIPLF